MAFTFVDLFAGCGGLSLGLSIAGGKGLLAVEKNQDAFDTLDTNLGPMATRSVFEWPAWFTPSAVGIGEMLSNYGPYLEALGQRVDVVAGGPPCQGFSMYGKRKRSDSRNRLYLDYLKVVEKLKPTVVLLENVEGINMPFSASGESSGKFCRETVASRISSRLEAWGYVVKSLVLTASEFGVPQSRTRIFIVGAKTQNPQLLTEIFDDDFVEKRRVEFLKSFDMDSNAIVSVKQAISDLEVVGRELIQCVDIPNRNQIRYVGPRSNYQKQMHLGMENAVAPTSMRLAKHSEAVVEKFETIQREVAPGQRVDAALRAKLKTSKHRVHLLDPNRPSVTITTLPDDFIHYSEPRTLTVRECARLQSFPDWFEFVGPYTSGGERRKVQCPRYTQVGNAVPPRLGQFMGLYINEILTRLGNVRIEKMAA
jgi:DNA (cytosine-5)-methyltransferase 1